MRTPVGRYGGGLADVRPDDLAAIAIRAAVDRAGVPEGEIEDVWLGCANQAGEDNRNVARMAVLLAGLPDSVGGVTVNRLCASGLAAIVGACHAVIAGDGDLFVAGGVESMTRAPLVTAKAESPFARGDRRLYDTTLGWRFPNPRLEEKFPLEAMGETGENVAERWDVSREVQDAFALRSQQRWAAAAEAGRFDDELVAGRRLRRATSIPAPTRPPTSSRRSVPPSGRAARVTAGNSSGLNDGAAAVVVASEEKARELGIAPLGTFVASAVAGVDPRVMGIGPVPAVRKLLERTRLTVADLDLVELNEAFASQSLAVMRELGLDEGRVNVNGGAIAIGHPLGMSGARLTVTLLHELRRRGGRYGLATMCVGVGQGQAALFEGAVMNHAERYLVLGLRLGKHVDGLVDAYYGPAELQQQVDAEGTIEAAQLAADADALLGEVGDGWLGDQVRGCATYAHVLAGDEISYADEVEGCYGVRPAKRPSASTRRRMRSSTSCCRATARSTSAARRSAPASSSTARSRPSASGSCCR